MQQQMLSAGGVYVCVNSPCISDVTNALINHMPLMGEKQLQAGSYRGLSVSLLKRICLQL